jgi:hypothetical protein
VLDVEVTRVHLVAHPRVPGEGHGRVARAVVRAVPGEDPAAAPSAGLAREFDRVLVGVGPAEGEEDPAPLEPRLLEEALGEPRPRLGAPRGGHEAEALGLLANGPDHGRVLVAEVHALGQAAHVEVAPALLVPEERPFSAGHGGGVPVGLDAPAVQDALALGGHQGGGHWIPGGPPCQRAAGSQRLEGLAYLGLTRSSKGG